MDREWKDFLRSPIYLAFGERKKKWNEKCKKCPYLSYCAGACPKTRPGQGREAGALGALCEGWEMFFQHALPRLKLIAGQIRKEREMALEREHAGRVEMTGGKQVSSEIGRNDPCRCGSGRKYKKCCGK
jgi:sulfatase maturation enzyme AslB (radical SAM superfamily)